MGRLAVEWCPAVCVGGLYREGALHDAQGRRRERVRFELLDTFGDAIGQGEAAVAWLPTPLNGHRPLFVCPECGHRRERLYALRGVACRVCWRLCHNSQKRGPKRRAYERKLAALRRLDVDADGVYVKPKWMRWRTYDRLADAANAAIAAAPVRMRVERVVTVTDARADDKA